MRAKVLNPYSDMGQIKIYSNELSCFFDNGVGDITNKVRIFSRKPAEKFIGGGEFLGHFTVRAKDRVYLSDYDCEDTPIYTFGVGRWWVMLNKPGEFTIYKLEQDGLEC